jgi:hypothetical protein
MGRIDKLARVTQAVNTIRRGEFTNYAKVAREYKYSYIAISRHVRGLIKTRREAYSF